MLYRTKWADRWEQLANACAKAGGPMFVPVDEETIAALHTRYDLPDYFEEMLRIGYPVKPIRLGDKDLFPSMEDLLSFRKEDSDWPRDWLPIDTSDGHIIYLLRPDVEGVFLFCREGTDCCPDDPDEETGWLSFDTMLDAILVLRSEIGANGIASVGQISAPRDGEWIRMEVLGRIVGRLGTFQAAIALEFFGLDTTAAEVYRTAREGAIIAGIGAFISGAICIVPLVACLWAIWRRPVPLMQLVVVSLGCGLIGVIMVYCIRHLRIHLAQMRRVRGMDEHPPV